MGCKTAFGQKGTLYRESIIKKKRTNQEIRGWSS